MCFEKGSDRKYHTAEEDITVYKAVYRVSNTKCRSRHAQFVYELDKVNNVRNCMAVEPYYRFWFSWGRFLARVFNSIRSNRSYISVGFHSFIKPPDLYGASVAVFVIPKGARYYINHDQRVSNKIIFAGYSDYNDEK